MINTILFIVILAVILSNPVKSLVILAGLVVITIVVAYIAEAYIASAVKKGKHEYTVRHNVWLVIKWTVIAILVIIFFCIRR